MLKLRRALASGQLQKAGANGAKIKLTLEDGSEYAQDGTLEFSEVSVDQTTGSVTLRAKFPNPDHQLLPGMFVHARLQTGVAAQAILVPQQGVTHDIRGIPTAMVVNKDNKVESRELVATQTAGTFWLVEKGLNAGDRVITEGLQYVKPGVEVKASEAGNAKVATPADANAVGGQGK
jgi:membrane fusion protein (multidrug efflux system)